jgi:uncharacterized membrane protein YgaE (UPF0421/DUF939 family)
LRWIVVVRAEQPMPAVVLFGVAVCFIAALVIADPGRRRRQVTMALGTAVLAGSAIVVGFVEPDSFVASLVLLVLIFGSFATRRWGLRAGELALLAAMGWYFAGNFESTSDRWGWYLLAVVVAIGWLAVWQFVILSYRPERSLDAAVGSYARRSGEFVTSVDEALWSARAVGGADRRADLARAFRQVELTRKVIESQFPGVLAPRGWTPARLERLQLGLFEVEGGLGQLLGAVSGDGFRDVPPDVAASSSRLLRALAAWLLTRGSDAAATFDHEAEALRRQASSGEFVSIGSQDGTVDAPAWLAAVGRTASGCARVARAIEQVRQIHDESLNAAADAPARAGDGHRMAPATVSVGPRLQVHPTTALGVQAVVATGLAMIVAILLGLDHANWVFWSAFVVIAGSAGESLRRVSFRVLGTLMGTTAGVLLVVAVPDMVPVVAVIAATSIFFAIFSSSTSYVAMVFWVSLGTVAVFARLGMSTADLLVQRPASAAIGAGIAAIVALLVVPVRVTAQYRRHVALLTVAVADAVARWVDVAVGHAERAPADDASGAVRARYEQVQRILPGVAFESNPLVQARSSLSSQATYLNALVATLERLTEVAIDQAERPVGGRHAAVRAVSARTQAGLRAITAVLQGGEGAVSSSLADLIGTDAALASDAAPLSRRRQELLWAFVDLHAAVVELAGELDVPTGPDPERRRRLETRTT